MPISDLEQAESRYAQECLKDVIDSCVKQARSVLARGGDPSLAEALLLKAYREESQEAAVVLADLAQARGDRGVADHYRIAALSIDKPLSEFTIGYRPSYPQGHLAVLSINAQPMELYERRLNFGFQMVFTERGVYELNGFAGYQHFLTETVVPYANVMVGALPLAAAGKGFNIGLDLGAKFCLGSIGAINVGFGWSRGSPLHASVGIAVNSLALLIPLAILGNAH